jgi:hypothetical protein
MQTWLQKKKKKRKKRKGNDDRKLLTSKLTYLNLIFCGPERTEKNWQSQGRCGYIHPPLSMQSLQVNIDRRPRLVVVHGSGRILNRFCEDIMQFSQWLLVAWQSWMDAVAIESQLNQMSSMIGEHHACFAGVWFSGFVRMGRGGPLEMITTSKVHVVSNGGGDLKCSNITANVLFTSLFMAG